MFKEERLEKILEIIEKKQKVLVKDLSERFDVSESMIRKDLKTLENEGKLKRTYGGAIIERTKAFDENTVSRVFVNMEGKNHIAHKVTEIIEEDDVIFLDISSTALSIAGILKNTNKNITVITNMNRVVMEFNNSPNIETIFIGGIYNKKLGGTIGACAIEQINNFNIDKAFIGAGGVNIEENFLSNFNYDESILKATILRNSKKNYILADEEKFFKDGAYKFGLFSDVDYLITDREPNDEIKAALEKEDVIVIF